MLYSILKFGSNHENNFSSIPFGHFIRTQLITHTIENKNISIEENTFSEINGERQRNLLIRYSYSCDSRVLIFSFYLLKLSTKFLYADNYFICVGPEKGNQYIWIKTTKKRAISFVNNKMGMNEYFSTGDIQIFKSYKKLKRHPFSPKIFRLIDFLIPYLCFTIKNVWLFAKGWSTAGEYNFSTGSSGRFEIYLFQSRELSKEEIRNIVIKSVNKKRAVIKHLLIAIKQLILCIIKKKVFFVPPVNVVIINFWRKEKRMSQMTIDPKTSNPLCICCAEWNRDKDFKWMKPLDSDERINNNFLIRWF